MSVLDTYKQPPSLGEMVVARAEMGARQKAVGAKRAAQEALVSEYRDTCEAAKSTYSEILRASVLGRKSAEEVEEARSLRDQLKERLEEEEELLAAYNQAIAELMETIGSDFNSIEMEKRRIAREFSDQHMKRVKAAFDAAAADFIALRYLCGRIDVASHELTQRIAVAEASAVKAAKLAARSLDAVPATQDAKETAKSLDEIPDKQAEVA